MKDKINIKVYLAIIAVLLMAIGYISVPMYKVVFYTIGVFILIALLITSKE